MPQVKNELKHFGILGMKWGTHRATVRSGSVKKAKQVQKAEIKKASGDKKQIAKANKKYQDVYNEQKKKVEAQLYKKGYDKETVKRVSKMSTGEAVAQTLILGSYGALKYNQSMAKKKSFAESAAKGVVAAYLNMNTFGLVSAIDGAASKHRLKK